jgi:hypothetical protein
MNPWSEPAGTYIRTDGTVINTGGRQQFWNSAPNIGTNTSTEAVVDEEGLKRD